MGVRRQGRIIAFQTLYRYDLSGAALPELLDFSWLGDDRRHGPTDDGKTFARCLIEGSCRHLAEIDAVIREHLQHWDFDRLSRVDCAILRMSVFCLLFQKDIPPSVTIDEAIHIAKAYGSDDSYRFINGILDAIVKKKSGALPQGG